jgi:hypothetical protein
MILETRANVRVKGLAGSAGGLLQIVPLVVYYVKLYILGRCV